MKCLALVFTRFPQTRKRISADSFLLVLRMPSAVQCEDVQNSADKNKSSRAAICEESMGTVEAVFTSLPG